MLNRLCNRRRRQLLVQFVSQRDNHLHNHLHLVPSHLIYLRLNLQDNLAGNRPINRVVDRLNNRLVILRGNLLLNQQLRTQRLNQLELHRVSHQSNRILFRRLNHLCNLLVNRRLNLRGLLLELDISVRVVQHHVPQLSLRLFPHHRQRQSHL